MIQKKALTQGGEGGAMKTLLAGLFFASIWVAVSAIGAPDEQKVQAAVVNKPTVVVQSLPEVKSTQVAVSKPSPACANATGVRLTVLAKYGIMCTPEGRFIVPPITDQKISLTERLAVIELLALNEGVPPTLLKAICWQEGWDRFALRRCENWYKTGGVLKNNKGQVIFSAAPGEAIKSFDGNGLCAFQITLRWHPEVDANRLRTDFTYCVQEAIRILLGGSRPASQDLGAWDGNISHYGDGNNGAYHTAVLAIANKAPVNPETSQPAW